MSSFLSKAPFLLVTKPSTIIFPFGTNRSGSNGPERSSSYSRKKAQWGYGDTELGFKYRFIDEDKNGARPMIGAYPLIELPTGDEARALGAGYVRAYFPVWIQKSFGDWTPMAVAVTGSTTAMEQPIATMFTSVGCCSVR